MWKSFINHIQKCKPIFLKFKEKEKYYCIFFFISSALWLDVQHWLECLWFSFFVLIFSILRCCFIFKAILCRKVLSLSYRVLTLPALRNLRVIFSIIFLQLHIMISINFRSLVQDSLHEFCLLKILQKWSSLYRMGILFILIYVCLQWFLVA